MPSHFRAVSTLTALLACVLSLTAADPGPQMLDLSKPGDHTMGRWGYRLAITLPGTRSEGRTGALTFDGIALPFPPQAGNAYRTPWGLMGWTGQKTVTWGEHGWMPATTSGTILPDPAAFAKTQVRFCHIWDGRRDPDATGPAEWIVAGMRALGKDQNLAVGKWMDLGTERITLHDSKHFGRAYLDLLPLTAADDTVRLHVTGDESGPSLNNDPQEEIRLPRRPESRRIIHHVLHSRFGPHDLFIAVEVLPTLTPPKEAVGSIQTSSPWEGLIPATNAAKP